MSRRYPYTPPVPGDVTREEAELMPSFFRVARISRPNHACEECREHSREPWINGSACDAHKEERIDYAGSGQRAADDARLALEVLRAGGNPEPRYAEGSIGAAQFRYRRKGRKADWSATVHALTREPSVLRPAA